MVPRVSHMHRPPCVQADIWGLLNVIPWLWQEARTLGARPQPHTHTPTAAVHLLARHQTHRAVRLKVGGSCAALDTPDARTVRYSSHDLPTSWCCDFGSWQMQLPTRQAASSLFNCPQSQCLLTRTPPSLIL